MPANLEKSTKQPDALDEPVANHLPTPFQSITGVDCVNFVGCNWSFSPWGSTPFGHSSISSGWSGENFTALNLSLRTLVSKLASVAFPALIATSAPG